MPKTCDREFIIIKNRLALRQNGPYFPEMISTEGNVELNKCPLDAGLAQKKHQANPPFSVGTSLRCASKDNEIIDVRIGRYVIDGQTGAVPWEKDPIAQMHGPYLNGVSKVLIARVHSVCPVFALTYAVLNASQVLLDLRVPKR